MTISIDGITRRKLVVVKQLYQQALLQSYPHNSFVSKMMSVIGFDLAIETILKAAVSSVNPSKTPSTGGFNGIFQQLTNCLNDASLSMIPDEANIRYVHNIRNEIQHKAQYPDDTNLVDCQIYTRDFLQKITQQIWGQSFDAIRLSELVNYESVKVHLEKAEISFEENNYQEAVNQAAAGLMLTLRYVQKPIIGSIEQSDKAFVRVQETLLIVVLGMDYSRYVRFRSLAPEVVFRSDGSVVFHGFNASREFTNEDAEFVVNYCIDAVVLVENRVGNIENPFGGKASLFSRLLM